MASAQKIKAGEAYIRLSLDSAKLIGQMRTVQSTLLSFGRSVGMIGAGLKLAGVGVLSGLVAASKKFATAGGDIQDIANRTGLSVEAVSELQWALELAGASAEDFSSGMRSFGAVLGKAMGGSGEAAAKFEAIGMSIEDLARLSVDDRLMAVADAIAAIEDPALATAAAVDLFGRHGDRLLPLLQRGSAGLAKMRFEAAELGLTMSAETAAAADELDDSFDALNRTVGGIVKQLGKAMAPAVQVVLDTIVPVLATTARWIGENKGLVTAVAAVAGGVAGLGVVLIGTAGAIAATAFVIGTLASVISVAVAASSGLVLFLASTPGMLAAVGLAAASAGSLMVDWGDVMGWLGQQMRTLGSIASDTFTGIADALSYGDIELAANILWGGLRVVWKRGVAALSGIWDGVRTAVVQTFNEAVGGVLMLWNSFTSKLDIWFWDAMKGVMDSWTRVQAFMQKSWHATTGWFADRMLEVWGEIDPEFDAEAAKQIRRTNDNAASTGIDADRDAVLNQREQDRANLLKDQESRWKAEQDRLTAAIVAKEKELETAAGKRREQHQAELDLLMARLDMLKEEAGYRRRMTEEGRKQLQTGEEFAGSFGGLRQAATAGFAGREIAAFRADDLKAPTQRTANAAEKIEKSVQAIGGSIASLARGLEFA